MNDMFFGCSSLLTLPNITNWKIDNVTEMNLNESIESYGSTNILSSTNNNTSSNFNQSYNSENISENSKNGKVIYSNFFFIKNLF